LGWLLFSSSGLVSWWPGDGDFNDIVDANIGTNAGATMFATGKVGQAFLFNGSPNSFITLPNSPNMLPASNQLTIDAWVKPDFSINNQWDNILAKRDGCGASGNSYNFGINKGDPSDPFGAIAFAMSSSDGGITRATSGSTTVPNDGQFHHVAATYDGSVMQVYLDGQLVGQAARSGPILTTTSAAVISHHGVHAVKGPWRLSTKLSSTIAPSLLRKSRPSSTQVMQASVRTQMVMVYQAMGITARMILTLISSMRMRTAWVMPATPALEHLRAQRSTQQAVPKENALHRPLA
jgi:Concanavalin A-like lectin/glucanases superfamily